MNGHTEGPLSYDGFGWGKLSDGSILIEARHAELAERRLMAAPALLEACMDATVLRGLVEKVEWMKRHADDLRSDCNEGDILETEMKINVMVDKIRAAIAATEGK